VYGEPEVVVLATVEAAGYEAAEFRLPAVGDKYLRYGDLDVRTNNDATWGQPRLILRRKTVKRRVLTETGEVRGEKTGELYAHVEGSILRAHWNHIVHSAIYAETFEEVEA